jgi:hypothetical protein
MSTSRKSGRSGSLMKRATLLTAFALLGSCAYNIDSATQKSDRDRINALTVSCGHEHTSACRQLGDDLTGTSAESMLSTWKEPQDLPLAKRVYTLCCESGEGECCRALVEQKLATSPEETTRYGTLAKEYGHPVRSGEEIAAAEAETQARVDKREEGITAERTEERNKSAQDMQAAGALIQQTGQQAQATIAAGTPSTPVATVPVVTKPPPATTSAATTPHAATHPTAIAATPAPAPACAPLHAACNSTTQCCGGTMLGNAGNYCTNGACCVMELGKCDITEDCCNAGLKVNDVCGTSKSCCRPAGVPSNIDGSVCCNGGNPRTGCH